jgi:pilus assembly protein Flp/PilA
MTNFFKALQTFWADEEGATAIEYGLLASLISVAIIVPVGLVRDDLVGIFNAIVAAL